MFSLYSKLCILIAAFCVTSACTAAQLAYDKRYSAPLGNHLTVTVDSGSVSIVGSDDREVAIHASLNGTDYALSRIEISSTQNADGVTIVQHRRAESGFHLFGGTNAHVQLIIHVPRDYSVELHSAGGAVALANLRDSVSGHVTGGSITADTLGGHISLSTYGGGIQVGNASGDLSLQTVGGSITLDRIDGRIQAASTGGGVRATVVGDHDISLRTSGGSITLAISPTIDAALDAQTLGGNVKSVIPLTHTSAAGPSHLEGTYRDGFHTIKLNAVGGSILVSPLTRDESTLAL